VAVTSTSDASVKLYAGNGNLINSIKLSAKAYPASLTFDKNGNLYIGDLAREAIYKASAFGGSLPSKMKIKGKIKPLSLTFSSKGLLVFDARTQTVKVIGNNLEITDFIKDKDIKPRYANGLFSDKKGVYVSDSNNRKVLRFDIGGRYHGTLKSFSLPRGLAVDAVNRMHVVDTFAHTVKVFNSSGKFLFNYGKEGSSKGQLYYPNSLAIDSAKGKIYVADKGNNRLQVWSW
jgi:DNA-binding beta-propeller fold protein YncE